MRKPYEEEKAHKLMKNEEEPSRPKGAYKDVSDRAKRGAQQSYSQFIGYF
jgi:hypothetical protein